MKREAEGTGHGGEERGRRDRTWLSRRMAWASTSPPPCLQIETYDDHRMAMAFALAACSGKSARDITQIALSCFVHLCLSHHCAPAPPTPSANHCAAPAPFATLLHPFPLPLCCAPSLRHSVSVPCIAGSLSRNPSHPLPQILDGVSAISAGTPVTILDPGCTRKTFPTYWDVLESVVTH